MYTFLYTFIFICQEHICICICMYTYIQTHVCLPTCIPKCIHSCIHLYLYAKNIYAYVYACIHIYRLMHVCLHLYIQTHVYSHAYLATYRNTRISVFANFHISVMADILQIGKSGSSKLRKYRNPEIVLFVK